MSEGTPERPKLRLVEAFPVLQQGREMVALRDPQGYAPGMVLLSPSMFYLASLCDGNRTIRDLQAAYVRRFGDIITSEQVARLVKELDDKLLLDSERFRAYKRMLDEEYLSLPNRPMACAGSAYPADPRILLNQLRAILAKAGEPGEPLESLPLAGVAPHIDLERGRECYGKFYRLLYSAGQRPADPLVVILGTCHGEMNGPFALTGKNYLTPFGLVRTDVELAMELARAAGMDGFGDELSHRYEHSIEVQLPFLCFLFGGADRFRILPITCNSFHQFVKEGRSPGQDPAVSSFVSALKGLIGSHGDQLLLIASADLAHVGRRFGSLLPLDGVVLSSVLAKDKEMLRFAEEGDAEGFFGYVSSEGDSRHVCGLPPIYTLLKALDGRKGTLVDHCHWFDQAEGSAVTFAALVYPDRENAT
ncbi:MAG: AmmeMemoRadiSam system protein B [Candidatus Geothermincolales bacterium]